MKRIDADAMKAAVHEIMPNGGGMIWSGDVFDIIDELPDVGPEPVRHGRWKPVEDGKLSRCTACRSYYAVTKLFAHISGAQTAAQRWTEASPMTPKRISNLLIIALAAIAAIVATGLIAGFSMWAWIVAYWVTLTAKNIVDCIGREAE